MPWKTSSIVLERQRFALSALRLVKPFGRLCAEYAISRKTGYKWLSRYRAGGAGALRDHSRRPKHCARQKPARWKLCVQALRRSRPHWGAKKILARLRELHPRQRLPALCTIGRWLHELGLVGRRARRGPAVPHPGLTTPRRRHQVWTVDFKGWFRTADGQRHDPLTVREARSRYLLEIRLLPDQSDAAARRAMTRIFRRHGLPAAIRVDNGSPFGGKGALGLSRLSLWWLRLGIRVEFTRRARPGDNAAHEQMHGRYKAEALDPPAHDRRAQQRRTDRWRHDYNHHRPHEALAQKPPARAYAPSQRRWPQSLPALCYPPAFATRRVRPHGDIKWQGRLRFIGRAFVGETLGLKALSPHHWAVHLGPLLIGELHAKDASGMRPAHWQRLPDKPLKV
jgi:transposase InsO family protein